MHHPGPWRRGRRADERMTVETNDGAPVASVVDPRNVSLIAAAPELYDFVRTLGYDWRYNRDEVYDADELIERAQALVRRAEGGV